MSMPRRGDKFIGEIQDLCNYDIKDWRRRDIWFLKRTVNSNVIYNYPSVGDTITIIDTDKKHYNLRFTKPEDNEKICLGTPSKLKPWYQKKGFSNSLVKTMEENGYRDKIYFEYTGNDEDFYIYTEKEFKKR
jgi:hypothetical protein